MSERKHFNLDMQNDANFRFVSKSNKARERTIFFSIIRAQQHHGRVNYRVMLKRFFINMLYKVILLIFNDRCAVGLPIQRNI